MSINRSELDKYWQHCSTRVDQELRRLLPSPATRPTTLHQAMHYSLFAGGKRLRPLLVLAACETCGGKITRALPAACAVELIHTYSLIHDDLPCMDDDDLRRGRPTSHKVYGEGIAVLTGDALLTQAFEIMGRHQPDGVSELARAAGSRMLIAGQVEDLEAEGRSISQKALRRIHEGKTAAMISVSLRLGAMAAKASAADIKSLGAFGTHLGLAFQVMDDILDCTQTSEKLGKSAGKDQKAQKSTYAALLGLEGAAKEAGRLTRLAEKALTPLGPRADLLRAISARLLGREY